MDIDGPKSGSPAISTPPSPSVRILLVEDHQTSRETLARLLRLRGFVVVSAADVAEAMQAVETVDHFNLLISDIGLPDDSGLHLMTWLRTRTPGLPGIALSAYGSTSDRDASLAAGFSAHLIKPASFVEVLEAVLRLASKTQH